MYLHFGLASTLNRFGPRINLLLYGRSRIDVPFVKWKIYEPSGLSSGLMNHVWFYKLRWNVGPPEQRWKLQVTLYPELNWSEWPAPFNSSRDSRRKTNCARLSNLHHIGCPLHWPQPHNHSTIPRNPRLQIIIFFRICGLLTILHNLSLEDQSRTLSCSRFIITNFQQQTTEVRLPLNHANVWPFFYRSSKMQTTDIGGQEPILPAVLEFPETYQDTFLQQVISDLDVNVPNFKLAPVYTLYLCAR